ncbi:MAG: DUF6602 domain-containing protein [Caldisericia bacterium]
MSYKKGTLNHPHERGDHTELEWRGLLKAYLPSRYSIDKATIIDSYGNSSRHIDLVIYDAQYSPLLFHQNGIKYIPAESVYAIFEIKPEVNPKNIRQAMSHAKSVRDLVRETVDIKDRSKTVPASKGKRKNQIFSGLLAREGSFSKEIQKIISEGEMKEVLNFGCSLSKKSFYLKHKGENLIWSNENSGLVFFILKLFYVLQSEGTVSPIKIEKYMNSLLDGELV